MKTENKHQGVRRIANPDKRHLAKIEQLLKELQEDGYTCFTKEAIAENDIYVYTDSDKNIGLECCENEGEGCIMWLN